MTALEEQVLALPRDSKHRLYVLLRAEFDAAESACDPMPDWLHLELEKRRLAFESGASVAIPAEEAFAGIRAELGYKK